MPQVIVRFNPRAIGGRTPAFTIHRFGQMVIPLIMEASSTEQIRLVPKDIDWIPTPLAEYAIASDLSLEIRTIGYPERRIKMNREAMLLLKKKIMATEGFHTMFPTVVETDPLIWVQFTDTDGVHV